MREAQWPGHCHWPGTGRGKVSSIIPLTHSLSLTAVLPLPCLPPLAAVLDGSGDAVALSKRTRTQVYSGKKATSGPQGHHGNNIYVILQALAYQRVSVCTFQCSVVYTYSGSSCCALSISLIMNLYTVWYVVFLSTAVPALFDISMRVLVDNIDGMCAWHPLYMCGQCCCVAMQRSRKWAESRTSSWSLSCRSERRNSPTVLQ